MKATTRQIRRRLAREEEKAKNLMLPIYDPELGNRMIRRASKQTRRDVVNNRKRTKGRNVQCQDIPIFEGKGKNRKLIGFKTIKHIIPSNNFIKVQKIIIEKSLNRKG